MAKKPLYLLHLVRLSSTRLFSRPPLPFSMLYLYSFAIFTGAGATCAASGTSLSCTNQGLTSIPVSTIQANRGLQTMWVGGAWMLTTDTHCCCFQLLCFIRGMHCCIALISFLIGYNLCLASLFSEPPSFCFFFPFTSYSFILFDFSTDPIPII